MRIGIDIMGGDFAPVEVIRGVLLASKTLPPSDALVLVGDEKVIRETLAKEGGADNSFEIVHASQVIRMGENPVKSVSQKTDSSIVKGMELLRDKKIDGFASAGNTGAIMVAALYNVKPIPNISRPALFSLLP